MIFAQIGRIATQFRGSRRELDSISKRVSFFSCWYSRTKISQTPRLASWEWWRNYRLHKTHQDDTSSVSNTADYNNISMTRAELGTCWIPGWARKRKKFSLLQITMAWCTKEFRNHTYDRQRCCLEQTGQTYHVCLINYQWQYHQHIATGGMQYTAWWIPKCHWNNEHNSALSSNKVPCSDIIPTKIYKVGGQPMTEKHS